MAGVGRRGWDSEQESSRVEGGKREDTSLLEGLGVWAGLGLHLQPDTPDTPALRVNGMQWSDMSHDERERETATEVRGLRNQFHSYHVGTRAHVDRHTMHVCVF